MIDLAAIVAWIESRGNQYAIRFEPTVYSRLMTGALTSDHQDVINRIQAAHSCSVSTAAMIYSTSFGRYQLMGFNIYGKTFSYKARIFDYLNDANVQESSFNMFVKNMGIDFTAADLASNSDTRNKFGSTYNGSADAYAPLIVQSLQHFGIVVS
jgi:hypothetical protein